MSPCSCLGVSKWLSKIRAVAADLCLNPDVQIARAARLCGGDTSFGEGGRAVTSPAGRSGLGREVERERDRVFPQPRGQCAPAGGRRPLSGAGQRGACAGAVAAAAGGLCPPRPGAPRRSPPVCRRRAEQSWVAQRGASAGPAARVCRAEAGPATPHQMHWAVFVSGGFFGRLFSASLTCC